MNKSVIFGIVLTLSGICMLAYQGFRFTTQERVVDIGPIKVDAERTRELPIPPLVGWVVTAVGVAVFVNGLRTTKG